MLDVADDADDRCPSWHGRIGDDDLFFQRRLARPETQREPVTDEDDGWTRRGVVVVEDATGNHRYAEGVKVAGRDHTIVRLGHLIGRGGRTIGAPQIGGREIVVERNDIDGGGVRYPGQREQSRPKPLDELFDPSALCVARSWQRQADGQEVIAPKAWIDSLAGFAKLSDKSTVISISAVASATSIETSARRTPRPTLAPSSRLALEALSPDRHRHPPGR